MIKRVGPRGSGLVAISLAEASAWLEAMYGLGYEVREVPPTEQPVAEVYLTEQPPRDGLLTSDELMGGLADLADLGRELPCVVLGGSSLVLIKPNYAP